MLADSEFGDLDEAGRPSPSADLELSHTLPLRIGALTWLFPKKTFIDNRRAASKHPGRHLHRASAATTILRGRMLYDLLLVFIMFGSFLRLHWTTALTCDVHGSDRRLNRHYGNLTKQPCSIRNSSTESPQVTHFLKFYQVTRFLLLNPMSAPEGGISCFLLLWLHSPLLCIHINGREGV